MDPTGETQKNPSEWVRVELYGGPLDGDAVTIPRNLYDKITFVTIDRCPTPMEQERYPTAITVQHRYNRQSEFSATFLYTSTIPLQ